MRKRVIERQTREFVYRMAKNMPELASVQPWKAENRTYTQLDRSDADGVQEVITQQIGCRWAEISNGSPPQWSCYQTQGRQST